MDFCETIPAYLNFAAAHIFFLYPKKLSYSSRNAYIKNSYELIDVNPGVRSSLGFR